MNVERAMAELEQRNRVLGMTFIKFIVKIALLLFLLFINNIDGVDLHDAVVRNIWRLLD